MKRFMYALCLIVLFSTACKKEETETPSTDTSTTTSTTNTGASDTRATTPEDGRGISVVVEFEGLICHIWDKSKAGVERAIVLRTPRSGDHKHKMRIGLPPESRKDIAELKLPLDPDGTCPDGDICEVLMDGLAFRFVDANGDPLATPFSRNANFANFVTPLTAVPHKDKPFAKKERLVDAVFCPSPKANDPVVAGWFELAGGKGDAKEFACKGKFENEQNEQDFVKVARVTFDLPQGAKMEVLKADDTEWRNITIPTVDFAISLNNDATYSMGVSHFHHYARLNKKSVVLPKVETPNLQECLGDTTTTAGVDSVPGCSNSAWP